MKLTIDDYKELRYLGYLNSAGLNHLIGMLEGRIIDYSEESKKLHSSYEFENPIGIKKANANKNRIIAERKAKREALATKG